MGCLIYFDLVFLYPDRVLWAQSKTALELENLQTHDYRGLQIIEK